jgi:hypothetical protein
MDHDDPTNHGEPAPPHRRIRKRIRDVWHRVVILAGSTNAAD